MHAPASLAWPPASFPLLSSGQLQARAFAPGDAPALLAMRSNAVQMKYVPRPLATSLTDAEALLQQWQEDTIAGRALHWALQLSHSPTLIGHILLFNLRPAHSRAEIGYMIAAEHAGKGLATTAVQLVSRYAFAQGFHSLEAIVHPHNAASIRVLQKAGFRQEAYFREDFYWNGQFEDSLVFGRLATDL